MSSNVLEIQGLSKSYGKKIRALSDCSFRLQQGKICAVVGASGSGKTTLLRLIAGLERPDRGSIHIDGIVASSDSVLLAPQKRKLGFVFQNYALFPHLTVAQNIAFGLKKNKDKTVKELLNLIKMEGYEKAYPHQLSGGQEQRVALARTLALKPSLLLLDEPFSNLDSGLKTELRQEVREITIKTGASMIFITHDIVDAIAVADEILFLSGGKVVEYNTVQQFSKGIQSSEVKSLLQELKQNTNQVLHFLKKP